MGGHTYIDKTRHGTLFVSEFWPFGRLAIFSSMSPGGGSAAAASLDNGQWAVVDCSWWPYSCMIVSLLVSVYR